MLNYINSFHVKNGYHGYFSCLLLSCYLLSACGERKSEDKNPTTKNLFVDERECSSSPWEDVGLSLEFPIPFLKYSDYSGKDLSFPKYREMKISCQPVVVLPATTGVEAVRDGRDGSLLLYPNPAGERIHVLLDPGRKGVGVSVRDLMGREVLHKKLRPENRSGPSYPLDISRLQSGIYLLSVETDRGIYSRRFIKE